MKQLQIISVLILSIFMFSCNAQENIKVEAKTTTANVIEVIDFHSMRRCKTCKAIEANTEAALEKHYAKELKDGLITFQTVNIEDEKNAALTEKFEATGTSLFINVIVNGVEEQINLTDMAFLKGKNKEEMAEELKMIIDEKLKLI